MRDHRLESGSRFRRYPDAAVAAIESFTVEWPRCMMPFGLLRSALFDLNRTDRRTELTGPERKKAGLVSSLDCCRDQET
jgi:hypothetical protein